MEWIQIFAWGNLNHSMLCHAEVTCVHIKVKIQKMIKQEWLSHKWNLYRVITRELLFGGEGFRETVHTFLTEIKTEHSSNIFDIKVNENLLYLKIWSSFERNLTMVILYPENLDACPWNRSNALTGTYIFLKFEF